MKKTLVALAALAATSAFAQSSVTISGNVDLGYNSLTQKGQITALTANNAQTAVATDATTRKTSNVAGNGAAGWTSSQVTLKVVEDMGNGTTAGYTNEMNLSSFGTGADASGDSLGTIRQSFVSLANAKNGEVRLGYQYTLEDQIQGGVGRATPTGNVGGRIQNFSLLADPGRTYASGNVAREGGDVFTSGHITRANAFQYASPVMSGFQALVQFAQTSDKQTYNDTTINNEGKGKLAGIAAKYSQGPLNLGFSHQTVKAESDKAAAAGTTGATANTGLKTDTKATQFAANYNFGAAKVFFNKFSRKTDITAESAFSGLVTTNSWGLFENGGSLKRTGQDLGVSVPMGATTLFAAVGSGKYKAQYDATHALDAKVKARLLGASYDLSKRTSLNAYYAVNKGTVDNQVNETSKKNVGFGIRHQF